MKRIAVFCGSNTGTHPAYTEAAKRLGTLLCEQNIGLVYGGGQVGLMGVIADTMIAQGGEVIGVIPHILDKREVIHPDATRMEVCRDMHSRKDRIYKLSDAFIAMPGGFGTLDELMEVLTWKQLGLHQKPVGVLNVAGFFDTLLKLADELTERGFVKPEHRALLLQHHEPQALVDLLREAPNTYRPKWMGAERTTGL